MKDENELFYDVSIKKLDLEGDYSDEDNMPTYLHITEEQLILLRWLAQYCWLDLTEADVPPTPVDLVKKSRRM